LASHELWADKTGQAFEGSAEILGLHVLNSDREGNLEQRSSGSMYILQLVSDYTASEDPSEAYKGATSTRGALSTSACADYLAIKAENCRGKRNDLRF
jgi:hypothetical protein